MEAYLIRSTPNPVLRLAAALLFFPIVFSGLAATPAAAQQTMVTSENIWQSMKDDVLGNRPVSEEAIGVVRLEAPKRAQDAALVPVDVYLDPKARNIKSLIMVIDVNPAPVVATFTFGKDAGVTHLATRVRVNDYSYLRAIAETADGKLHMVKTFIKASGGCSAPAVKNTDEAMASMGQMKLKQFPPAEGQASGAKDVQLMIRHPNNSGLQRDPLTQYFIPAHFVQKIDIKQGDRSILSMEGGISISEDPNFRFDFVSNGPGDIVVDAVDTEGKKFADKWPLESAGL